MSARLLCQELRTTDELFTAILTEIESNGCNRLGSGDLLTLTVISFKVTKR